MILVAGATTEVGREVVRRLLAAKHPVRVMVRAEATAEEYRQMGAEAAVGDVTQPETLPSACWGADTVISLVGRHYAQSREILFKTDAEGNRNLIHAAKSAGARNFILMSLLWTDRGYAPVIIPAKAIAEEALRESGLPYSILRPATFMTGPNSLIGLLGPTIERWGLAVVPAPDSGPISFISVTDLAEAICSLATRIPPENRAYELGGSEKITLRESAALVGRVLGRRVRVLAVPRVGLKVLGHALRPLAFSAYESYLFLEMMAEHGYHCAPDSLREILGREPQSVEEVVRAYYAGGRTTSWRDSIYGSLVFRFR